MRQARGVRIDAIVFDCVDAAPLARFWASALGWSLAPYEEEELERLAAKGIYDPEEDTSVMVEPPEDLDLPALLFTEVPESKVVKNRVHLDLVPDGELEDEVERLESLGASVHNWTEEDGGIWCVMQDPEGNEFCVMPGED
ncbi:MAG: VOC family protein [Actinobacteria bacterium]|nr:VOC family protein [Actinomycetota bacterium]